MSTPTPTLLDRLRQRRFARLKIKPIDAPPSLDGAAIFVRELTARDQAELALMNAERDAGNPRDNCLLLIETCARGICDAAGERYLMNAEGRELLGDLMPDELARMADAVVELSGMTAEADEDAKKN